MSPETSDLLAELLRAYGLEEDAQRVERFETEREKQAYTWGLANGWAAAQRVENPPQRPEEGR